MKLIRRARLHSQQAQPGTIYEVHLCEVGTNQYVVNYRHGRQGTQLREGSKTVDPVGREEANQIFDSVVVSKLNSGYVDKDTARTTGDPQQTGTNDDQLVSDYAESSRPKSANALLLERLRERDPKRLARLVWRAGERRLTAASEIMLDLLGKHDSLTDYCIAWALARCGDSNVLPVLARLRQSGRTDAIKRVALVSSYILSDDVALEALNAELLQTLPAELRTAAGDSAQLTNALHAFFAHANATDYAVLETLYILGLTRASIRQVVLDELRQLPFKPPYFRIARHLFKAAEQIQDPEIFGLLTSRFDTQPALFNRAFGDTDWVILPGGSYRGVKFSKEIVKADSRLAYSNRTRDYFRHRAWRTLRRLGDLQDLAYVDLAVGVLLAINDGNAADATASQSADPESPTEPSFPTISMASQFDQLDGFLTFNHIIHGRNSSVRLSANRRTFIRDQGFTETDRRTESFPALWDQRPQTLLHLLLLSRCTPVHAFAAKALWANQSYCADLDSSTVGDLLRARYKPSAEFGLKVARLRYKNDNPDLELLNALVTSRLKAAREQGIDWIGAAVRPFFADSASVANWLGNPFSDVRSWARDRLKQANLSDDQADALIVRLTAILMNYGGDRKKYGILATDIATALLDAFPIRLSQLGLDIIEDLLGHPLIEVQMFAARLLVNHQRPPEALPVAFFDKLLNSAEPRIRAAGVELFGKLPEARLKEQHELLSAFCTAADADIRRSAHAIAERLTASHHEIGAALLHSILPHLFRKEPKEHFHSDLLTFLKGPAFQSNLAGLDQAMVWRLLKARSKAAVALGGHILVAHRNHLEFNVRQWAWLGNHQLVAVRQWAQQAYTNNSERVQDNPSDGLRILDSEWVDTREFGIVFFSEQFTSTHWTPELLVSVCDSIRDDVQAFGRDLVSQFFEEQHGAEYLLKLSQHPTTNVQLFATNYLESYAADDPDKIRALTRYFITVLSQVNRGRVAKSRIIAFLHRESVKCRACAEIAAAVFTRQSVTAAITDRAAYLEAMLDIHQRFPDIALPIALKPVREVARRGI